MRDLKEGKLCWAVSIWTFPAVKYKIYTLTDGDAIGGYRLDQSAGLSDVHRCEFDALKGPG